MEHREALSKYRDVSVALSNGYQSAATYVQGTNGVMTTPFINPYIDTLDPERPQILLYDLTPQGTYELVGTKWYRPATAVDAAPRLFGRQLNGPQDGHVPSVPEHYGLTAWLFRENPDGLFEPFNPAIEPVELVSQVTSVRQSLEPYLSGGGATDNGYMNTETCLDAERGFYGVPFVNDAAETTTPSNPPILLYRVTPNWNYVLLGVEWYVPTTEAESPPSMFGFEFHEPLPPHGSKVGQGEHYGLHAWLFTANPRGMFEPFNPALSC